MVRPQGATFDVAVIHPHNKSIVRTLPKGHLEAGETIAQAAEREVREETGLTGSLGPKLGEVRYVYRFQGRTILKQVTFFLLRWQKGEINDIAESMRDEVALAFWMPIEEALASLSYPGERQMVTQALKLLRETLAP